MEGQCIWFEEADPQFLVWVTYLFLEVDVIFIDAGTSEHSVW